jgi:hypothetical protein
MGNSDPTTNFLTGTGYTVTLPAPAAGNLGKVYVFVYVGGGADNFVRIDGTILFGTTTAQLTRLNRNNAIAELRSDGTQWVMTRWDKYRQRKWISSYEVSTDTVTSPVDIATFDGQLNPSGFYIPLRAWAAKLTATGGAGDLSAFEFQLRSATGGGGTLIATLIPDAMTGGNVSQEVFSRSSTDNALQTAGTIVVRQSVTPFGPAAIDFQIYVEWLELF